MLTQTINQGSLSIKIDFDEPQCNAIMGYLFAYPVHSLGSALCFIDWLEANHIQTKVTRLS